MLYLQGVIQEEFGCDYPGCCERFDQTDGARVAIVKNNQVLVFCAEHAKKLLSKSVPLLTIEEANAQKNKDVTTLERFAQSLK